MNSHKNSEISPIEIGHFLSRIREQAGIKQAELAKKITWSPAMLSRIEVGDRQLSPDELQTILEGINTPEALHLSEMLYRQWSILPRPPLSHPDQDILWNAEQAAQKLLALSEQPEIKQSFQHRLEAYIERIEKLATQLLKREHQIAFIGSIGIGKSTAICQLANLTMPNPNGNFDAVLEVGSGGITVCEVHVLSGSEYEIRIEPRTDDEIRTDIRDFAVNLLSAIDVKKAADRDGGDNDSQGISKEIQRALRNMSGLIRRSEKQATGKPIRTDKAKELAQQFPEERDLIIEIMARMELHKRDRRNVLYNSSTGKPPLKWLKDTFELINNGRHPDFTLPKRIEVVVKDQLLAHSECLVRIIDTKGIDNKETAARPDLEGHLKDLHTITVLCSGFNDAPARNPWQLLERAKDIGVQTLELNSSLLILPHTGEALKEKDEDSGQYVESEEEGYERKAETVEDALEPLGLRGLPIYFFNAYQDNVEKLREFLNQRLTAVRNSFRIKLDETIEETERLLENHEQEQVQEVIRSAGRRIESWVRQHETLPTINIHVQDDLINAMDRAYANTIKATIWRKGKWDKLDYCHHLSYGSRLLAAKLLREHESKFNDFCMTLSGDPEYADAQDFIKQAQNTLSSAFQALLSKIELTGESYFSNELASAYAAPLWGNCEAEYGQGYRARVVQHNRDWFNGERTIKLEKDIYVLIEREWRLALNKVSALIEIE
ncbi:MAG: helix-turn-helix transcriptional regulator [Methylovulum sp.]|nr:helix-turn-helix transcriptional regulator [Methylovulum sp.]